MAIIVLSILFNAILKLGVFPKIWKTSQIIMIPKPGKDLTVPSSYRPISLKAKSIANENHDNLK